MSNPVLQFVDGPSSTATVRYDFNSQTATCRTLPLGGDGLDLGNPSYDGEPGGVGARYGYRPLRLTQRIIASKAVALARMSVLAKELLREGNWLRVQVDPTLGAVYFKTYRTEPGAMSMEWSETAGAWDVTVPLEADPFAYGAAEIIPTLQIIQAPADLAGPVRGAMHTVLPAIKGEAPTPLRISLTPATGNANSGSTWLVGCIAGTTAMSDQLYEIGTGDTVTALTGTAAASADATCFGGTCRIVTIAAATPNLLPRFTMLTNPVVPLGRYKVMLRCATNAAVKPFLFRVGQVPSGGAVPTYKPSVAFTNPGGSGQKFWVDLGDINLPFGVDAPADAGGASVPREIYFDIGTADGTATTLIVDAMQLIPVDGPTVTKASLIRSRHDNSGFGVGHIGTYDGETEQFWKRLVAGLAFVDAPTALSGSLPDVDPAAGRNLLIVMATDSADTSATQITSLNAQLAVDISYYPKYLHVGDGT